MMHRDLAQWLGANITGLKYHATNPAGVNVFVDHMPSQPDRAVGVFTLPGTEADSKLPYDDPGVELLIRGEGGSPTWALDTWRAVYHKLHGLRYVTLPGGTVLVYALVVQSSPVRLGQDENGRHQYAMNVRTEVRNPTQERPS